MTAPIYYCVSGSADRIVAELQRIQINNPGMVVEGSCMVFVLNESIMNQRTRRFDTGNIGEGWYEDV